jgi:hypothetical protein
MNESDSRGQQKNVKTPMNSFEVLSIRLTVLSIFVSAAAAFAGAWAAYYWFDPSDKHGTYLPQSINLKCRVLSDLGKLIDNNDLKIVFANVGRRPIGKTEIYLLHDDLPASPLKLDAGGLGVEGPTSSGPNSDRYVISTPIVQTGTLSLHATGSLAGIWVITDTGETTAYYVLPRYHDNCFLADLPSVSIEIPAIPSDNESETTGRPAGISAASGGANAPSDRRPNH